MRKRKKTTVYIQISFLSYMWWFVRSTLTILMHLSCSRLHHVKKSNSTSSKALYRTKRNPPPGVALVFEQPHVYVTYIVNSAVFRQWPRCQIKRQNLNVRFNRWIRAMSRTTKLDLRKHSIRDKELRKRLGSIRMRKYWVVVESTDVTVGLSFSLPFEPLYKIISNSHFKFFWSFWRFWRDVREVSEKLLL